MLHQQLAQHTAVRVGIITLSDTRTPATDVNKAYLEPEVLSCATLVGYRLVPDDTQAFLEALHNLKLQGANVIISNGGTGIAPRDRTYETLEGLIQKPIVGFGELFRMLSYQEIGSAAMLSRACAGLWEGVTLFALPGSPHAVRLGWERLIKPELAHVVWESIKSQ